MRYLLSVFEPLDTAADPNAPQQIGQGTWLDDTQTSFHVITQLGTGFFTCQVGLPSSESMGMANPELARSGQQLGVPPVGWLPAPVAGLRQRAHIVLRAGASTIFEGRVTTIFPGPGGWPSGFLATGYGASALSDLPFTTSGLAATTTGPFLVRVLRTCAPLILPGNSDQFVDPGVTIVPDSSLNQYPAQIISQFGKAGAGGTFWDFAVWEGRTAWFQPRTAPSVPTYLVPWDNHIQQAQVISDQMSDTVILVYGQATAGGTTVTATETATNPVFFAQNGFRHTALINGGTMSKEAATAYVASLLSLFAHPQFSAQVVYQPPALRDDAPLTTFGAVPLWSGQLRPSWMVRAGEWLQIGAAPTTQENVDLSGPHIIQRTEWSSASGQLTITVGEAIQDWVQVLTTIGDHVQALRAKVDPNTGGGAWNV